MTYDAIAQQIIREAQRRGYDPVPPLSTAIQESGLRPGAVSSNGKWIGVYQQDESYGDRYNATSSITQFFDRLDAKRRTDGWSADLWLNIFWLQQRPGEVSAALAYQNGRQAYLTEIKSRTATAQHLVALYGGNVPDVPAIDYGITKVMHGFNATTPANATGNSNGPRRQTAYVVVHTQEGDGTAASLANYLNGTAGGPNPVSYNLTVDAVDTVEVVPVGEGPWAAGDANDIAVHLCFAGSRAAWSRADWLDRGAMLARGAKAVAAACKQFNIPAVKVLSANGWPVTPKGIAGHVDFGRRGGGHHDPGEFVWPEFIDLVKGHMAAPPTDTGVLMALTDAEQHELLAKTRDIWDQLRGPGGGGWPQLNGRTPVDALADVALHQGIPGYMPPRKAN